MIVQVCAAFWDFCEEHPDYASLLLREAFETESSALLKDGGAAREVVAVSLGYVEAAQARGELRAFDVEAFSLWVASYMLGYHGAPGLRGSLQRKPWGARRAREQFVGMVRSLLRGSAMGGGVGGRSLGALGERVRERAHSAGAGRTTCGP
ncbi:MAG: hypothetical protein U0230_14225 [Polyangiales bacterium]